MFLAITDNPAISPFINSLPAVNATLNGLTTLTLLAGYISIKTGKRITHACFMSLSLLLSTIFLSLYLTEHAYSGGHYFHTPGWPKTLYFIILIPHVILAMVILPFIAMAVYFAAKRNFDAHVRVTRWLWPAWMYVSVTGVLVYLMLYVFFPDQPRVGL